MSASNACMLATFFMSEEGIQEAKATTKPTTQLGGTTRSTAQVGGTTRSPPMRKTEQEGSQEAKATRRLNTQLGGMPRSTTRVGDMTRPTTRATVISTVQPKTPLSKEDDEGMKNKPTGKTGVHEEALLN